MCAAAATEASEAGVAGARPADHYMYVCGEGGAPARYECAFEPGPPMEQPPFEEHMFAEFGKERHVAVAVGAADVYREELPFVKRKEEPLLLQPPDAPHHPHPHPPPQPTTTTTKKSEKKKSDNNGIKKKKTRSVHISLNQPGSC